MLTNKKIATAIAAGALVFNSLAVPAFAATTLQISGNGADSQNDAKVDLSKTTFVNQDNKANINNNVDVNSSTGGNSASKNTGGDVSVKTGDSDVKVLVSNTVNKNEALLNCCSDTNTSLKIADNGADSKNKVDFDLTSKTGVEQKNDADINNRVNVESKTGKNDANKNTNGDVSIETGDSSVGVGLYTMANMNMAQIGGSDSEGGSLNAWVTGNGADSKNDIDLDLNSSSFIVQHNDADIKNNVDVDASTGKNDANKNTGGEVSIETGDVNGLVQVENAANFNWADMSCGACLFGDLTAKIADNGADSKNKIDASVSSGKDDGIYQSNDADVDNCLYSIDAKTGYNDANENTSGTHGSDPAITTGDADFVVKAKNDVNTNAAGLGVDLDFDFDLMGLWSLLH